MAAMSYPARVALTKPGEGPGSELLIAAMGRSYSFSNQRYNSPAIAAPMNGATQNIHNWATAQPPTISAGPVLRAGFTEVLVTGILTR